jgi:hypothetical protein
VLLVVDFICVHSNGPVVGAAIGCWVDLDAGGETEARTVGRRNGTEVFCHHAGEHEEMVRFDLEVAADVWVLVSLGGFLGCNRASSGPQVNPKSSGQFGE